MTTLLPYLLFVPTAYLLGAVPFGYIVGRVRGIDIRTVGSKNIGATNVLRSVGKGWGILTLLLDALKGLVPAALFPVLAAGPSDISTSAGLSVVCGCAAVLGHNFPIYLKFKGGKGVATTAGALVGIAPLALLCGIVTFAITFGISRYVSLGSCLSAIVIPLSAWIIYRDSGILIPLVLTLLGLLALWRHKANIKRLLSGTENRIEFKKSKSETA
jgi:glycerol-3-phosphate acyltransferase PlsY